MIYKNLTNTTTNDISSERKQDIWLGISGTGTVAIEFFGEDGIYHTFPQATFTAPTAQVVTVPARKYRFKVTGGPLTIEASV